MKKRLVMLQKDINVYFKKNDVVEILEVDEKVDQCQFTVKNTKNDNG